MASVLRLKSHYCDRIRSKLSELFTSNCTLSPAFIHYITVPADLSNPLTGREVYNSNIIGRRNLILTLRQIDAK